MNNLDRESPSSLIDSKKLAGGLLSKVALNYRLRIIEPSHTVVTPSDSMCQDYATGMELLLNLPEADREEVLLKNYCFTMKLREDTLTSAQIRHFAYVGGSGVGDLPPNLGTAHQFIWTVIKGDNLFKTITTPGALYIVSHCNLGTMLPDHFNRFTNDFINYIFDPINQPKLINVEGKLNLQALVKVHAMALARKEPEIILEGEDSRVEVSDEPLHTDVSKKWRSDQYKRKQKGNQKRNKDW